MNKLAGVLAPVRADYVHQFESTLTRLRATMRRLIVEPEIRDSHGDLMRRGALATAARLDVMAVTPYGSVKAVAVDSEAKPDLPRSRFMEGGIDIGVAPLLWESMELWAEGHAEDVLAALTLWFEAAFRIEENRGYESIQDVVHFMSDPVSEQGLTSCVIDLGTAPLTRVMALFDHLRRAGVRRVDLGQLQN